MENNTRRVDALIVGAGAAGLFCAAHAGQAGLKVMVVDNGKKPGRKILMSGGGRCNFTNMYTDPGAYLSQNPHFCKSALARYSQWDFTALVGKYAVAYREKSLGQLFCDNSAEDIVDILLQECRLGNVELAMRREVLDVVQKNVVKNNVVKNDIAENDIAKNDAAKRDTAEPDDAFVVTLDDGEVLASAVVIATGGLSMPGLGATPLGYRLAQRLGLGVIPTRAGLVPFTLHKPLLDVLSPLSGISLPVAVTSQSGVTFKESMLFTHRGLSGPAILQISNYWSPGETIAINLLPDGDAEAFLSEEKASHPNQSLKNSLAKRLPKRLVECLQTLEIVADVPLRQLNKTQISALAQALAHWQIVPNGTEGYRTAEVTLGGVDTRDLSSKTMEATAVPGLYFIGEVVDVTGWLGGYNFQWAWSSARACSTALIDRLSV